MRKVWTILGCLGLAGCGAAAGVAPLQSAGRSTASGSSGSAGGRGNGTSSGGEGASTTTTSGGTFGASGASGSSGGAGSSSGGTGTMLNASATLDGSLAFAPAFEGELYGLLPDGGADLTNVECRLSNGFDLWNACGASVPIPAVPDGGLGTSSEILDIYVTSLDGTPLTTGEAPIEDMVSADGGVYATVQLTTLLVGDVRLVLIAGGGDVSYQVSPEGISGSFSAEFVLLDGGAATLSGAFGAPYCSSLSGY